MTESQVQSFDKSERVWTQKTCLNTSYRGLIDRREVDMKKRLFLPDCFIIQPSHSCSVMEALPFGSQCN